MSHDMNSTAPTFLPDDDCARAMRLQVEGRLDEAERVYREILRTTPEHAIANHCIGMLSLQRNLPLQGLPNLLAALQADPTVPDYWLGYIDALHRAGDVDATRDALALGREHGLSGAAVEALAIRIREAAVDPPVPSRAERRRDDRELRDREAKLSTAIHQGQIAQAVELARSMTVQYPMQGMPWKILGAVLCAQGPNEEGLQAMQHSARLLPADAEAHSNLGRTLNQLQRFVEAQSVLRQAIAIDPTHIAAYAHLGECYQLQGLYADAEACFRRVVTLRPHHQGPDDDLCRSNLLFMLSHDPSIRPQALFDEHVIVGEFLEARQRANWPKHRNLRDPARRLQVGFVSGDLRRHAVATFLEPVFAQLKRLSGLRLYAYSNHARHDEVSLRLRDYFHEWRDVATLNDRQLSKQILQDEIDILIDLSGHSALNRLRVFGAKPAPLQVSWVGYPGTTGLRAMDYYLADRQFLPPGQFDDQFTEKLAYLPANAPFVPVDAAPEVNDLPALTNGHFTFGSFNRLSKISGEAIRLWSGLLGECPDAIMLFGGIAADGADTLRRQFAGHGISSQRLVFHPRAEMQDYLALHHRVDLCLDTLPYSGGTTTSHALWMGVPTLTIAGGTPASRQSAAFLSHLDLDSFVARDERDFLAKGVQWSNQLSELSSLRRGMRVRWRTSSAGNPSLIAAGLERLLRQMWVRWCSGQAPATL